ncbi:MAG: bifunctional pyr operon transcriptional regulator/uracil phosphoribosyltransferase PyrR [Flavobacteriia bacterium]|jgi:pyrimidine operon attenuation protein/uracil phosphoribosyltransferase|nr:bifunctional pyr operon transcriptional regulator/uracil phosphoribosyltransferase PyrR [Flavobacteriia bacterium]NDH89950.1 bifunctional pyr operon transcriptional regulator/uracil phosphoribosyltransferase PyrR [Flavobacteriia bacterium]
MATKTLLDARECAATLNRLCCQLNEVHFPWNNSVIIGLQPRGTQLAKALIQLLKTQHGVDDVPFGALDITFHRDDFRRREEPLAASPNEMNVLIEGKRVILVDDVLYTGRSVRAAMDALGDYGRPTRVELCVLVDRRFSRELPIQPDFSGRRVDAIAEERVRLEWANDVPTILIESIPHAAKR